MSFFSYALGCSPAHLRAAAPGQGRPGTPGVARASAGVPGRHRAPRAVLVRRRPPRELERLALGAGLSGRRRRGAGRTARPLHAGVGDQRLGGPPGQRGHHGAVAGVARGALRGRQRQQPRGRGEPGSGELPPLSRSDPRRAVLRGVPPRPCPCGSSSGRTRAGRCRCNSPRGRVPSSPPSVPRPAARPDGDPPAGPRRSRTIPT